METGRYFITYGIRRRSWGERMMCYKLVSPQSPFNIQWSSVLESVSLPFEGFLVASIENLDRQVTGVLTSCLHSTCAVGEEQTCDAVLSGGMAEQLSPVLGPCHSSTFQRRMRALLLSYLRRAARRGVCLPVFSLSSWVD